MPEGALATLISKEYARPPSAEIDSRAAGSFKPDC